MGLAEPLNTLSQEKRRGILLVSVAAWVTSNSGRMLQIVNLNRAYG